MPNARQRRENARRRFDRQQERRQAAAANRRRTQLIAFGTVILVVLVGVGIWALVALTGGKDDKPAASAATPSASAATPPSERPPLPARKPEPIAKRAPQDTKGPCGYAETEQSLANPNAFDVGLPPDPAATPNQGTVPLNISTNNGDFTIDLDRAAAPCNVQSISYLASKKFFDNTACPRSVSGGIFVLQCGDPTTNGRGGPTYQVKDENLSTADYREGTVAMANSGPNTNASQFFIIYQDSNAGLAKNYTVIGHVSKGLDVVKKIAAAGDDGSNPAGGGRPNTDLIFQRAFLGKG